MTTAEKEKYKCLLPSLTPGDEVNRRTRERELSFRTSITPTAKLIAFMLTAGVVCFVLCQGDDKLYTGPSPGELLEPLFKRTSCSYRVRLVWS